jgi:hypothetical protein
VVDETGATKRVTTFRVRRNRRRTGLCTTGEYVGYIVNGLRTHGVEDVEPAYIDHVIDMALDTNQRAAVTAEGESALIGALRRPPRTP